MTITSTTTYDPEDPASVEFELDASILPEGGVDAVVIFVSASAPVQVGEPCTGGTTDNPLSPDPCVFSRSTDDEGDGHIVVKTTTFSVWNFGVSVAAPTPTPTPTPPVLQQVLPPTGGDPADRGTNLPLLAALGAAVALLAGSLVWAAARRASRRNRMS